MVDETLATDEQTEEQPLSEEQEQLAKLKEALVVKVEDIGTLRRKLTITVPQAVLEERRRDQFGELKRDSVVPGFRKGHAPMKLVEKRFGADVNEQLSSRIFSSSYMAAIEKEGLKTLGDPMIWAREAKSDGPEKLVTVEKALDMIVLPAEGDLQYSCEVELRPEFELPVLEGLELTEPDHTISDADVDQTLERLRQSRGQFEPLTKGKIQADDLVICNFKAVQGERVIHEEQNCLFAARPMSYAGIILDKLGETLVGAASGQQRQLTGRLPDDYADEALRGSEVDVTLDIQDVKRFVPAPLDELLAGLGMDSADELRSSLRSRLEESKAERVRALLRTQVRSKLVDSVEMQLPDGLSQRQTEHIAARRMLDMAREGVPEQEIAKHLDEIRTGAARGAVEDLKLFFIFEKIAESWEVSVTEEELNAQIAAIAREQNRRFDRVRDDLMRHNRLTALAVHIRDDKILDGIIGKAKITREPTTKRAARKKD
jgi:trigger factor